MTRLLERAAVCLLTLTPLLAQEQPGQAPTIAEELLRSCTDLVVEVPRTAGNTALQAATREVEARIAAWQDAVTALPIPHQSAHLADLERALRSACRTSPPNHRLGAWWDGRRIELVPTTSRRMLAATRALHEWIGAQPTDWTLHGWRARVEAHALFAWRRYALTGSDNFTFLGEILAADLSPDSTNLRIADARALCDLAAAFAQPPADWLQAAAAFGQWPADSTATFAELLAASIAHAASREIDRRRAAFLADPAFDALRARLDPQRVREDAEFWRLTITGNADCELAPFLDLTRRNAHLRAFAEASTLPENERVIARTWLLPLVCR